MNADRRENWGELVGFGRGKGLMFTEGSRWWRVSTETTRIGRLKRSSVCSGIALIASATAVLTLGTLANAGNGPNQSVASLQLQLLGIPLAPGWFLMRSTFERVNLSDPNQILFPAGLVILISFIIDTVIVFTVWELIHGTQTRFSHNL